MFNRNEFRAAVVRSGQTLEKVATDLGINPATLSRKMSGESDFSRSEMEHLRQMLHLDDDLFLAIFFAEELA